MKGVIPMNDDPLFDAQAAAEYLGLAGVVKHPAQAVRNLARKRKLQSTRIADKLFFRRSWLEQYITQNTRQVVATKE